MKSKFLLSCLLAVLVSFSIKVVAQTDHIGTSFKVPQHPRILMFKSDEAAIRATIQKDPTWTKLQWAILNECDRIITLAPVERIQIGRRLLDKSREALRRLFFLSYGYRMTGEKKYLDRAEKEMLAISAFSDWNPSHFCFAENQNIAGCNPPFDPASE